MCCSRHCRWMDLYWCCPLQCHRLLALRCECCGMFTRGCKKRGWESTIPRESAQKKPMRLGSSRHMSTCARTDLSLPTGSCFGIVENVKFCLILRNLKIPVLLVYVFDEFQRQSKQIYAGNFCKSLILSEAKASRFSEVWPL